MIRFFESLSSTQEQMKSMLTSREGDHLDVVWTKTQYGGRGRHGNAWVSPSGNLAASVFIKSFSLPLTWIPIWVGVALLRALKNSHESLREEKPKELLLKWPNDLVLRSGEKVGGILCEKVEAGVIAGIGLNLETAPIIPGRSCSSIREALGGEDPLGAEQMIHLFLKEIEREPTDQDLLAEFSRSAFFIPGDLISWMDLRKGEVLTGAILGLGMHGELKVKRQDGQICTLFSEEIQGVGQGGGRNLHEE